MSNQSKSVQSNQNDVHLDLEKSVQKHLRSTFNKPFTSHTLQAFSTASGYYEHCLKYYSGNFILDSGCGVGESTLHIAEQNPNSLVLGIDQSQSRIERESYNLPENARLLRTDCIDFWRLAFNANWQLQKHFILYPNPWPKKKHLLRRWHGHPVFPVLSRLGGVLELRTNWKIYAEEFAIALQLLTHHSLPTSALHLDKFSPKLFSPKQAITPFERKYSEAGQLLYQVSVDFEVNNISY